MLSVHVRRFYVALHVLEFVANGVLNCNFLSSLTVPEEFLGVKLVLRGRVGHLVLEEALLSKFEGRVVPLFCRNRVLSFSLFTTGLLQLAIAELLNIRFPFDSVEFRIRLHHRRLLVLRNRLESALA